MNINFQSSLQHNRENICKPLYLYKLNVSKIYDENLPRFQVDVHKTQHVTHDSMRHGVIMHTEKRFGNAKIFLNVKYITITDEAESHWKIF